MYTPKHFNVEDTSEAHALMRAHPFAVLVTQGTSGIVATHLPTVLRSKTVPRSNASNATWLAQIRNGATSPPTVTRS